MCRSGNSQTSTGRLRGGTRMHMKTIQAVGVAIFVAAVAGCSGTPQVKFQAKDANATAGETDEWNFDKEAAGKPFADAVVFSGAWEVRAEADAPSAPHALCQTATADFPSIRLGNKLYADLIATVRFKPISGKDDQAAGIIFRIQDKDNYYILRANAQEDNVIFFRYGSGRRTTLKEGNVKVASGKWQELKLEAIGNQFRGSLD